MEVLETNVSTYFASQFAAACSDCAWTFEETSHEDIATERAHQHVQATGHRVSVTQRARKVVFAS